VPDVRPTHRLTPRQHRIARLAASGYTNEDIAEALAISVNTVKARLKQAFERLDVTNRIELAGVIKLHAPPDEVAPGVTHLETVAVTRAL
jgi:DNA-binding NarL/FixJ family response regulator